MTDSPPRKGSVDDIETGVLTWELCQRFDVYLDGAKQDMVIAYDCDRGTVHRHVADENGRAQLNEELDEVLTETVTGVVTVEWTPV